MKTIKGKLIALVASLAILASTAFVASAQQGGDDSRTANKVRKELVTLPYYGVFDNLAYKVDGDTVTLYGQVVDAITRKDAERRVKKIEGVERVVNNIQVLPVSGFDNTIRVRTYRTLARTGSLYRYFLGANPSIHIIVNRGHVSLEGVVSNKMDSQLAYMTARGIPGVFSVTNNLRVERD
ncbi:MAG TPA: BON domain-containing protein [Blastocatellia bacterium]|nr:BON domain-containing protein [Blastocatellia bacterium]